MKNNNEKVICIYDENGPSVQEAILESFNREYNQNSILKDKKKARNKDFLVSEMDNYQKMIEELDKHQDNLNKANKKIY